MTTRMILSLAGLSAASSLACAQSMDQSRAFANELYSDSASRVSALDQGAKVFAPKFGGIMVTRYNWNQVNNVPTGTPASAQGLQMAYMKLTATGNVIDEAWSYGFQFKFNEFDGLAVLDDAWTMLKFEDQWNLKWGQFKMPVLREENISDGKQLAANRSPTNSVFTAGRSQGVLLTYAADDVRAMVGFGDGLRTNNTDYTSNTEADWALTGRAEYKWQGEWKQYDEFTAWREAKYFGAVGGAVHYQSGGRTVGTVESRTLLTTVDVMAKGNGWNAYAAAIYRNITPGGSALATDDIGFLAQLGAFVGPKWELFGRYDVVVPDKNRTASHSFNSITVGANRYVIPESHAAKFTVDVIWMIDKQNAGIVGASTLTGVRASGGANQVALQVQFQLLF